MAKKSVVPNIPILLIMLNLIIFSAVSGQSNLSRVLQDKTGSDKRLKVSISYSPLVPVTGIPVRFIARANNTPETWLWEFGDGEISYESSPSHIYETAGIYNVKVTVSSNGITASATKKVRIYAAKVESTRSKGQELVAAFDFSPATPETGVIVQFTDQSAGGPTSWRWNFGDGSQSTVQNPQHQFSNPGTYNVTLTVSNGSDTKSVTRTLTVIAALTPGFNYTPANPESVESIQFKDTSTGNPASWNWDFGDGTTSNLQNPSHIYGKPGSYTVILKVSNGYYTRSVSKTITVLTPISVDFSYSPANPVAGQDVQFINNSSGSITGYSWNFGDGTTSTVKDPTHKYNSSGSFTVTLTATGPRGSKSVSKTVTVSPSLSPSFTYSPASPYAGQAVQFTDTSGGNPTSWQWNFGDGSNSTVRNPSHTYSTAGTYTVTLTVSNGVETKIASKNITVKPVVQADFTYSPSNPAVGTTIQFTDKSSGNITSWSWQFGDGTTSTQKNPSKVYSSAGSYNVKLTVSDGETSNSMTQTVNVVASLVADFSFSPASPTVGQEVQFLDNSLGSPNSWSWDFGDGAKSTAKNPTHTYSQAGTFTVKLTISNGTSSATINKSLTVSSSSKRVITAASCELTDVRAAIAQANPGDEVVVPNGTAVWREQLLITKGVILKAATKGGVRIISGFEGDNYRDNNYLIKYEPSDPSADEPFRLSGFIFDCDNKTEGILLSNPSTIYPLQKIRIDNNEFYRLQTDVTARVILVRGMIYGVADNNVFHNDDTIAVYRLINFLGGPGGGQYVWQYHPFEFGSANNFYVEDNTIYTTNMIQAMGAGGRCAFRYNNIIVNRTNKITVYLLDIHGNMGSGGNWGGIGIEFYNNTINYNGNGTCIIDIRGGKALIYNNALDNVAWTPYFQVREEYHDSLNPPARHLVSGQPQYVTDTYVFNQTKNGNKIYLYANVGNTIDYGGDEGIVPREDVHFFSEKHNFDGSSGIGIGLLSQRPAFCTKEGVAWWATDEQKLYRWKNGKWELYYVPYPYPHPLRSLLGD